LWHLVIAAIRDWNIGPMYVSLLSWILCLWYVHLELMAEVGSISLLFCFEIGFHCVPKASLKLQILLTLPPECWDYRLHHCAQSDPSLNSPQIILQWTV
jgi:hypothetical protein